MVDVRKGPRYPILMTTREEQANDIRGYQLIVGREVANLKTHPEACAAFFAAAADESASCVVYSLTSDGGIGSVVLENMTHYAQRGTVNKLALKLVKDCEKEIRRLRAQTKRAA